MMYVRGLRKLSISTEFTAHEKQNLSIGHNHTGVAHNGNEL